jgi:peptidoglycan/xylan/chitin deacetylase (PgdA/CDA1 family)
MFLFKKNPPPILSANRLEIVLYHFVSDGENDFTRSGHTVGTVEFRRQLEYLAAHYTIVRIGEIGGLRNEVPGRKPPFASVCFDDGYRCILDEAYPVLQELRIPAMMFVSPSVIGNRTLLWRDKIRYLIQKGWEEEFLGFLRAQRGSYNFSLLKSLGFYKWSKNPKAIRNMAIQKDVDHFFAKKQVDAASIAAENNLFMDEKDIRPYDFLEFGNHTWSHPIMTLLSRASQREEIVKCHEYLKERGVLAKGLALPFSPYDGATLAVCRQLQYDTLLTVYEQSNDLSNPGRTKPVILHRRMAPKELSQLITLV